MSFELKEHEKSDAFPDVEKRGRKGMATLTKSNRVNDRCILDVLIFAIVTG